MGCSATRSSAWRRPSRTAALERHQHGTVNRWRWQGEQLGAIEQAPQAGRHREPPAGDELRSAVLGQGDRLGGQQVTGSTRGPSSRKAAPRSVIARTVGSSAGQQRRRATRGRWAAAQRDHQPGWLRCPPAAAESRQQVMSCAGERRSAVVGQGDRQADGQSHARVMGCSRRIHAAQDRAQRTRGPPERCKGSVMAPKLHHRDRLSIARAYVCTTGSRGLSCGFGRGHAPAAGAAIDLRTLPIASRI